MYAKKVVAILLFAAVLLGACAPTTPVPTEVSNAPAQPAQPTQAEQPASAPEQSAEEAKPVVVSVWVTDAPAVRKAAEEYEKLTGKKVIVEEIAREVLQEKEKTELTAKTGAYDILWVPSEWVAELAEGQLLEPLNPYMENSALPQPDQADWASPGAVEAYNYKGNLYGYPVALDTVFLYYRTDLIEKAPDTWDEYLQVAKEQTNDQRYGATLFGKLPESIAWDFINYFWSFGGEILDENFRPTVNSPEGVAALTYFTDLLNKDQVVSPGVSTYEYPEVLAAFQQDKAAMVLQWNAAYADFGNPEASPAIFDKFAATVLPGKQMEDGTINRKVIGHVWGFVMNASSQNKEEAYSFLVYLTGKEGLQYFPTDGASINVNSKAVLSDPAMIEAHPEFELLNESFQYLQLWPTTTATSQIILTIAQEASSALVGSKTPQQAMDDANKAIDDLMQQAGYY